MSKFKFSYVFWAVLAAAALFVAACDNGSDSGGSSGPGLLKAKTPAESSVYAKAENSGNGATKENPVVVTASMLEVNSITNSAELSLAGLVDVGTSAPYYEIVEVSDPAMKISTGIKDVKLGELTKPAALGSVTVRVSNGATGQYLFLRVDFDHSLPKLRTRTITRVSTKSAPKKRNEGVVTIKSDESVILNDLLPSSVTASTVTWSIVSNDEKSTEKDSTFSINQLKDTAGVKKAGDTLAGTDTLFGVSGSSLAANQFQPYQPASTTPVIAAAVHYGTVKIKASVKSVLVLDSYTFTVVFAPAANTLAQATSATSGAGLVFDTTAAKDGSTKAKAIIVNTKDAGASSPAHALFLSAKVTVADLTSGAVGTLTYKKASGEEDFTAVTIPTSGANSGKIDGLATTDTLILEVTDPGNATTLGRTLYFKIPFRKDASALTISGDSRLAALEANAKDFAGVIDFPAFAVKTAAPANVDQTTGFDFGYSLVDKDDAANTDLVTGGATLGTTADPGQLPSTLTAGKTYKLTVTATPKSTNTEYAGAKSQDFFFNYVATTFGTALADDVKADTVGIAGTEDVPHKIVKGLAIDADAAKQAAGNALEVWLKASDYFDANGVVKPKTPSGSDNYVVAWDAYVPGTPTTSVKFKTGDTAADTVKISKSQTDSPDTEAAPTKLGRMTIDVGADVSKGLMGNVGAVVVVSIYDPVAGTGDHSLSDKVGRLARYELRITKPDPIDLTGTTVTAKAKHSGTAITDAVLNGTTALTAVTVGGTATAATVTLATANASTAGHGVAFNTFKVDTAAATVKPEEPSWTVKGIAAGTAGISATNITPAPAAGADATPLADAVRADFTSATGENGQVTLTATDKYGQTATIVVTLDDKLS